MSAKNMRKVDGIGTLDAEAREALKRLAALPEDSVDTADIPELPVADFPVGMRLNGRPLGEVMDLYRARKTAITARIDRDVLEWLKSKGRGYQTKMNAILREAMMKDQGKKA